MTDKKEKKGLGRGLSALMADIEAPSRTAGRQSASPQNLPIERIEANPDQPRKMFNPGDLDDLAKSIREKGIIQPLIVRPKPGHGEHYQIVAGERRWRAAQQAQLHEVPVVIRDIDDTEMLEIAIIENIQRADLNPVEEALGYRQLQDRFGHTQEQLASALGKSRSHIANLTRLLTLPEDVLDLLRTQKLTMGHARALVVSPNASLLAARIVAEGLSVRQAENLAKSGQSPSSSPKTNTQTNSEKDADTRALENDLSAAISMKVAINHKPGKESGELSVSYKNLEQLDWLCQALSRNN